MRGLHAVLIPLLTALALSGCMRRPGPVATVPPPPGDLDAMAYGGPRVPTVVVANSGGAIGALRAGFASRRVVPAPAVYAAPMPVPVAYDAAYKLDAGDRLR